MFRFIWKLIGLILTIIKELIWRLAGLPFGLVTLLGIKPKKYLRIKIIVPLLKNSNVPLIDMSIVEEWVRFLVETYREKMDVILRSADFRGENQIIEVTKEAIPENILNIKSGFSEFFSNRVTYFAKLRKYERKSFFDFIFDKIGYGEPIYIFFVKSIGGGGTSGLAYPIGNIIFVSIGANMRTIPHEIGHMCLLPHHPDKKNFMFRKKNNNKDKFTRLQSAWARGSRFVTYLNS